MRYYKILLMSLLLLWILAGSAFAQIKVETRDSGEQVWRSRYTFVQNGCKYTIGLENSTTTHDPKVQVVTYFSQPGQQQWPVYVSNLKVHLSLIDGNSEEHVTRFKPSDNIADDGIAAFQSTFVRRARFALPQMKTVFVFFSVIDRNDAQYRVSIKLPPEVVTEWKKVVYMNGR